MGFLRQSEWHAASVANPFWPLCFAPSRYSCDPFGTIGLSKIGCQSISLARNSDPSQLSRHMGSYERIGRQSISLARNSLPSQLSRGDRVS